LVGSLTLNGIATGSRPVAFKYVAPPYDRVTGQTYCVALQRYALQRSVVA
jgi:hypothetical protein